MRIWKDSATIEEKLQKTSIAGKKRGRIQREGKNREEWDCFLLGKDARTRSTKNEHVGGHVSNGSEIYLEVSLCHILGHINNSCFDICVFFHFLFQVEANVFFVSCCAHSRFILCLIIRWPSTLSVPNNTIGLGAIIDSLESARPIVFEAYETILRGYARAM